MDGILIMDISSNSFVSFLKAQRRRQRAFEEGVYELDSDEGFTCLECGWKALTAPMVDTESVEFSEEEFLKCVDCESTNIECGQSKIEYYQVFGYEYSEFPEDIPTGKEEKYKCI